MVWQSTTSIHSFSVHLYLFSLICVPKPIANLLLMCFVLCDRPRLLRQPPKYTSFDIQMASWGGYVVLALMILFYICNLYCCCKFFYFGGWAWPLKQIGRGIFRRYVAGVRTTSTGKMVFEDLTEAELQANSNLQKAQDALGNIAGELAKFSHPEKEWNQLMHACNRGMHLDASMSIAKHWPNISCERKLTTWYILR